MLGKAGNILGRLLSTRLTSQETYPAENKRAFDAFIISAYGCGIIRPVAGKFDSAGQSVSTDPPALFLPLDRANFRSFAHVHKERSGMQHVFKQTRKHILLTAKLNLSTFSKGIVLLAIAGIVLYSVLFSTTPAIHDFFHELRHSLMIIPCH